MCSATQTSRRELGEDGDTGWLLEGLAGSRVPNTGCPKAPVSPLELERGRRGGNRALTFQEAVPDPLVLPPGVSLGHLLEGLDPFGAEGLNKRKKTNPKVSERRGCQLQGTEITHKEEVCAGWHHEDYFYSQSGALCLHENSLSPVEGQWQSGKAGQGTPNILNNQRVQRANPPP